jgi:hypothetical protein
MLINALQNVTSFSLFGFSDSGGLEPQKSQHSLTIAITVGERIQRLHVDGFLVQIDFAKMTLLTLAPGGDGYGL